MSENDNVSELLEHHGILGMKWGVRRTPAQLGHAPAKPKQAIVSTPKAAKPKAKPSSGKAPSGKNSRMNFKPAMLMTDAELKMKLDRLKMERDYNDTVEKLRASTTPSKVKKFFGDMFSQTVSGIASKGISLMTEKIFEKDDSVTDITFKDLTKVGDQKLAAILKRMNAEKSYESLLAEANERAETKPVTKTTFEDLDKMDLSKMTPSMLKKASETYQNAGKIYNWRKQMSGSADQSTKGSADQSAKGSAEPQITKAETANTKKSFPSLKLYRGQAFVGTALKQRTSAYTSDSFSKGMSFTQKYLYGKSGSDDRNEKLAFQKYETKKSERVEKAVAYTQKRLDEQRKANAERDMRRLGL